MKSMRLDRGQIEIMDRVMVPILRAMTPERRLASAHSMWSYAVARVDGAVRHAHPDWTEQQIKTEIRRRFLKSHATR